MSQSNPLTTLSVLDKELDIVLARLRTPQLFELPAEVCRDVAAQAERALVPLREQLDVAWQQQLIDTRAANSQATEPATAPRVAEERRLFGSALLTSLPLARKLAEAEALIARLRGAQPPAMATGATAIDAGIQALALGKFFQALRLWAGAGEPAAIEREVQVRREKVADELLEQGFLACDVIKRLDSTSMRTEARSAIFQKAIEPVQRIGTEKQREQIQWLQDELEAAWSTARSGSSQASATADGTSKPAMVANGGHRRGWIAGSLIGLLVVLLGAGGFWITQSSGARLGLPSDSTASPSVIVDQADEPPAAVTQNVPASASPLATEDTAATVEPTVLTATSAVEVAMPAEGASATPTAPPAPSTAVSTKTPSATPTFEPTETVAPPMAATGRIAFTSRRDGNEEIYTSNPEGVDPVNLTRNPARDYMPSWSPDGAQLVFMSDRDGIEQLYVMNADGSGQRQLTTNAGHKSSPRWSPDGRFIAFDLESDIYLISVVSGLLIRLSNNDVVDTAPAWAPDSKRVAYTSFRSGNFEIYYTDTTGSSFTPLTDNPAADLGPAWSPDGNRIAFISDRTGKQAVYVMEADGSDPRTVAEVPGDVQSLSWSPDGEQIVFDAFQPPRSQLYIVGVDGRNLRQLTDDTFDGAPAWSPPD